MEKSPRSQRHRRGGRPKVVITCGLLAALALSACGSGTSSAKAPPTSPPTTGVSAPVDKTLGKGVTATTIRLGVALVDFKEIAKYTDTIRTNAEEKQIYQIFIDDINKKGGIHGRKIVPFYRFYSALGNAQILTACTAFAEDDNVFAVVGTFIDFSGDAQTCVANQQHRVLMTFNLTQAIIDKSPAGLIITAGSLPERSASILIQLLKTQKTLDGKTVAVLGDTTEANAVNKTIVPGLKAAGVTLGTPAILSVGTTGDTTAAQSQLDSFIEKWKTEHVSAIFLSGNLASTKQFVEKLKGAFPDALLMADNTDVLEQAKQEQTANKKPNPYEGILTAGGLSPRSTTPAPTGSTARGSTRRRPGTRPRTPRESSRPRTARSTTPTARSTTRARPSRCSTTSRTRWAST